jgi:hypothetical protein
MLTRKAVRWYMRGLFPPAATTVLLLLMFLAADSSLKAIKTDGMGQFIALMEYIFLPIYAILIGSHVFRDSRTTVFELSIFNGPQRVFIGRLAVATLGLLPGIVGVALLTWWRGYPQFLSPLLLKIPVYVAFIVVLMAYLDSLAGTLTLFVLASAIPMSFSVLLGKPGGGSIDALMSSFAYLFATLTTVKYRAALSIGSATGYSLTLAVSTLLVLWGYFAFSRKEFAP